MQYVVSEMWYGNPAVSGRDIYMQYACNTQVLFYEKAWYDNWWDAVWRLMPCQTPGCQSYSWDPT